MSQPSPESLDDTSHIIQISCPIVYSSGMATVDRLNDLLDRFSVRARQFHTGALCGLRRFDVVPGRGAGFSLEAPEGLRFLTRSRLFTDAELKCLAPAAEGDQPAEPARDRPR